MTSLASKQTALFMQIFVIIALLLIGAGIALQADNLMTYGLFTLVFTPFIGVCVNVACFLTERKMARACIGLILIAVIAFEYLFNYLF